MVIDRQSCANGHQWKPQGHTVEYLTNSCKKSCAVPADGFDSVLQGSETHVPAAIRAQLNRLKHARFDERNISVDTHPSTVMARGMWNCLTALDMLALCAGLMDSM